MFINIKVYYYNMRKLNVVCVFAAMTTMYSLGSNHIAGTITELRIIMLMILGFGYLISIYI